VGIHPTLTTEILRKIMGRKDVSAATEDQKIEAREKNHVKYMACALLMGS